MKNISIALFFVLTFVEVSAQSGNYCIYNRFSENTYFDSADITIVKNVVYSIPKKWPGTGFDTLKLDLYYPSSKVETLSKRPCIVFFYGGAWLKGSKNDADIKQKCFEWARRGFVVAAPNYRLGWNCSAADLFQVCVLCQGNYYDANTAVYRGAQDGKAAMRFIVANQSTYNIDTSALFIGGESAGSFNANHAAHWDHNYAKKVFNGNPYKILGGIDSAGSNIGVPFRIKGIINSCGAVVNDTALKLKRIATVFFHDDLDCVAPYKINQVLNCCATSFFYAKGSYTIYDELSKKGVPSELHTVQGITPQHCSYPGITLVKESSCFIKRILCGLNPSGSMNYPTSPSISCNSLKSNGLLGFNLENFKLFPIPANQFITLKSLPANEIKSLSIYSIDGKELKISSEINNNEVNLITTDIPIGVYILKIKMLSNQFTARKIVISR